MRLSAAPLLAACFSPRCLRCFLFQRYSVWCMASVIARLKPEFNNKTHQKQKGMPMPSETKAQVVAKEPPNQTVFIGNHRARRGWLAAVVVFLAVAGILASGILRRVRARAAVTAET